MSQRPQTILLRGGLDLITPQIAMPDGRAIAALNYEPDDIGYTSTAGYERFDGRTPPSDGADAAQIAALRSQIGEVPGSGPVRGVWVFQGTLLAFRDTTVGGAAMYKSSAAGWVRQTFGHVLEFVSGTNEFFEGETVAGGTSSATATIKRVVVRAGAWDGTAEGYLVLSDVVGTFQSAEAISSSSGDAAVVAAQVAIDLYPGGSYDFVEHNFYGAARIPRLYFTNGAGTAFEWDGQTLVPIRTGVNVGDAVGLLLTAGGPPDRVLTAAGDRIVFPVENDIPAHVRVFRNHLFLGYEIGAIVFSAPGEPIDYRTTLGAGEFSFGGALNGMVLASTALILTGSNRIEYVAGNDADDFQKLEITTSAGAMRKTMQVAGESPIYLDDAGLRRLSASSAYGDFKLGTLTRLVEPLLRKKRLAGIAPATAIVVKAKDHYRLYWADGSGVALYMGRKDPEILPFKLPATFFCSCAGETDSGMGERVFAGSASDGYVYELNKGTSFDGAAIDTYLRLAFNDLSAPSQRKVFHRYAGDVVCEDDITVGIKFDIDYATGDAGAQVNETVDAGAPIVTTDDYGSIDWSQPVQGELVHYLYGIGRNIAVTKITSSSTARPHTFPSSTLNVAQRGLVR